MSHQLPGPLYGRTLVAGRRSREREVAQLDVDLIAQSGVGQAALGDEVGHHSLTPARQRRVVHVPEHLHKYTRDFFDVLWILECRRILPTKLWHQKSQKVPKCDVFTPLGKIEERL